MNDVIVTHLCEWIDSGKSLESMEGMISGSDLVGPDDAVALRDFAQEKVSHIKDMLQVLNHEDVEDGVKVMSMFWMELRTEWMRYNALANSKLVFRDEIDIQAQLKAAYTSALLAELEQVLPNQNAGHLESLLLDLC